MTSNARHLSTMLGAVLLSTPSMAGASYGFTDSGFDIQGASVTTYCYLSFTCPTGPWSGGGAGFVRSGDPSWGGLTAPSTNTLAFLQETGTLSQTFTATQTLRVVLAWMEADRPYVGGQTYIVFINGAQIASFTSGGSGWVRRVSAPFNIAAGSSYTVTFAGTATTDKSALLDSVDLAAAGSTTAYVYDALGRLISSATTGGVNNGVSTAYTYDAASNRTNVTTTGAPE